MKLETILDAMEDAGEGIELRGDWQSLARKRDRQYKAFRARIIKMDGELEASEAYLAEALELMNQHWERIQDLKKQLAEKDAEIEGLRIRYGLDPHEYWLREVTKENNQ